MAHTIRWHEYNTTSLPGRINAFVKMATQQNEGPIIIGSGYPGEFNPYISERERKEFEREGLYVTTIPQ
jgi:hypothetical protein